MPWRWPVLSTQHIPLRYAKVGAQGGFVDHDERGTPADRIEQLGHLMQAQVGHTTAKLWKIPGSNVGKCLNMQD